MGNDDCRRESRSEPLDSGDNGALSRRGDSHGGDNTKSPLAIPRTTVASDTTITLQLTIGEWEHIYNAVNTGRSEYARPDEERDRVLDAFVDMFEMMAGMI